MQTPYGSPSLAHAVTVVGLGGSGKTQLVLNYINCNVQRFECILWIDCRDEETASSSFERCCRALSLAVRPNSNQTDTRDAKEVQTLLLWLQSRQPSQEWLVVLDNVNNSSWNVDELVPLGPAGSVIVISQDRNAARMIGRDSDIVKVDALSTQQAISLLLKSIGNSEHDEVGSVMESAEKVVTALDNLPWAIDVAGANISVDLEGRYDLQTSLRRFLSDFERHGCDVLRDRGYDPEGSLCKKDIRAVWDTTFQSLRRIEANDADAKPLQLLQLLATLSDTDTVDNVFRAASPGWDAMCDPIKPDIPPWLEDILNLGADGDWDDFSYRSNVGILLRYRLVRMKSGTEAGLEMHSLLRRKIREELTFEEKMELLTPLFTAAGHHQANSGAYVQCQTLLNEDSISDEEWLKWRLLCSRSSLTSTHLLIGKVMLIETTRSTLRDPMTAKVSRQPSGAPGDSLAINPKDALGLAYSRYSPRDTKIAREIVTMKTVEAMKKTLGPQHVETARAMYYFALNCREEGELEKAAQLFRQSVDTMSAKLGPEHEQTVYATQYLALTHIEDGFIEEAHRLLVDIQETASGMVHDGRSNATKIIFSVAENFDKEGWRKGAERVLERAVQDLTVVLGERHPDTCEAIRKLADLSRSCLGTPDVEQQASQVIDVIAAVRSSSPTDADLSV